MKRTKEKTEIEDDNEERQAMFSREISEAMKKQGSRFIMEPSYVPIENLIFGRLAFGGVNPEIERMMADDKIKAEEQASEKDVDDVEMASAMGSIAKKFATKRKFESSDNDLNLKKSLLSQESGGNLKDNNPPVSQHKVWTKGSNKRFKKPKND